MEKTLILLKPDCMQQGICGKVIDRFESAGFKIAGCKMMQLTKDVLAEHYAHIADQPFYPEVEAFMMSTPVIGLVLEGDGIIDKMREMLGVTNSLEAAEGTIRAEWGSKEGGRSMMLNVCHASDGPDTAAAEVKRFFGDDEVFAW